MKANNRLFIAEVHDEGKGLMLLIDKPEGYTSAKAVNLIRRRLKVKKAGHSGTLDPNASGLLIVCTDKMTKKLGRLLDSDKIYEGEMILGATSESFDTEREIQSVVKELNISEEEIKKGTRFFTGIIKQTPPVFSAVKYKGKPSYKYARKGINIERKERTVKISEFTILKIGLPSVFFRIACSKGTYIRSVVNDFGEKLGTGAYLKSLRRLSIGEYNIKNSVSLDNFLETGYALCTTGDKS